MDASAAVDQENIEDGREKQRFYLRSHSERILFSIQSLGEIFQKSHIRLQNF